MVTVLCVLEVLYRQSGTTLMEQTSAMEDSSLLCEGRNLAALSQLLPNCLIHDWLLLQHSGQSLTLAGARSA